MNGIQCPECGTTEVSDQASSCPGCGYPILALSGFRISKRLKEAAPGQTAQKEVNPKPAGQGKGTLKAKLSRAKSALAKKGKRKSFPDEILIPARSSDEHIVPSPEVVADLPIVDEENLDSTLVLTPGTPGQDEIRNLAANEPSDLQQMEVEMPADLPRPDGPSLLESAPPTQSSQLVEESNAFITTELQPPVIAAEVKSETLPVEQTMTADEEEMPSQEEEHAPASLAGVQEAIAVSERGPENPEPYAFEGGTEEPAAEETLEAAEVQAECAISKQDTFEEFPKTDKDEYPIEEPKLGPERITLEQEEGFTPLTSNVEAAIVSEPVTEPEPESIEPEPMADLHGADAVLDEGKRVESPVAVPVEDYQRTAALHLSTSDAPAPGDVSQCYECGMEVDLNANFCHYCHASLLRRYCPGCRRLVAGNTAFCAYCGNPATALAEPPRNFATVFAVLIIVFTAVVIFLAKDSIFEDPTIDKNIPKMTKAKSSPPASEPTTISKPVPVIASDQVKKVDQQPVSTTPERRNKDGLIESTISEDGSLQQDSTPQESPPVPKIENQQQAQQKSSPIVEASKETSPSASKLPPAGLNDGWIAGLQTYKHRDSGLARYLNSVGYRLIKQRRYEEAIPILKRSVSYFPDNTRDIVYAYALFNLGHALRMSGRAHEAIPVLEARLKIDNQRESVKRELAAARVAALGAPLQ